MMCMVIEKLVKFTFSQNKLRFWLKVWLVHLKPQYKMNIFRKNDFLLEIYQRVKTKPLRLLWRLLSTVCYINNSVFSHFETISAQMKIILNSLTANIMSFCSWFLMQDIRVRLEVSLQPAIKLRCFPECSRLQLVLFWKKEKWQWKATFQNFLYVEI